MSDSKCGCGHVVFPELSIFEFRGGGFVDLSGIAETFGVLKIVADAEAATAIMSLSQTSPPIVEAPEQTDNE